MKRNLSYQVCYVIAAIGAFGGSAEAAGIATVTDVVNEGFRRPPGHEEQAARRADELVQNEALRTDDESSIHLTFVDGSELSLEAQSEVVLSDYVYDGAASRGLINLNDGLFHFTSNGQNDQGVKLKTPVATIGVRGTEFLVHVPDTDTTIIDILSGMVEAKPNGKGKPVTCSAGQSILVAGADVDAQCGDLGSFSSAAGEPGPDHNSDPGHNGQDKGRPGPGGKEPEPPAHDDGGGDDGQDSGGPVGEGGGSGSSTMLLFDDDEFELG